MIREPLGSHFAAPLPPAPAGYRWEDRTIYSDWAQRVDVKLVPRWWSRLFGSGLEARVQVTPETPLTSPQLDSVRRYAATTAIRTLRTITRKGTP